MKKIVHVCLLTALLTGLGTSAFANGAKDRGAEDLVLSEPGTYPLVEEKATLSCFATLSGTMTSFEYEENSFTKVMEDLTNVHIEWKVATEADAETKFNLIIASGDYPDMFMSPKKMETNLTKIQVLGDEGVLTPLESYITEGTNMQEIYNRFPRLKNILTLPDGHIYSMPSLTGAYHAQAQAKMWIYEPWLKALGLDMPETTAEFQAVLRAFKERDPNGNGLADEIPLVASKNNSGWNSQIDTFLMSSFIYNDSSSYGHRRMLLEDGKVVVSYDKPEWREGLRYMKGLYDEGLMASESFTQTKDQLKQMVDGPSQPVVGTVPGGWQGSISQISVDDNVRWKNFVTVPPLEGPTGYRSTPYFADMGLTDRISDLLITTSCDYPELAFRWGDTLYDPDVSMRACWGVEGVNFELLDEDSGIMGVDGDPAKFRVLEQPKGNVGWNNRHPRYLYFADYHSKQADNPDRPIESVLYAETHDKYLPYVPDADSILPLMAFSPEAANEVAELETQLKSYVNEMVARFVIGDADLDADWDDYLDELNNIGLERYVELYQAAVDANM